MNNYLLSRPFDFLSKLADNNNRDWFNANKPYYLEANQDVITFSEQLHQALSQIDVLDTPNGKKSLHRIYRDVRFSKDKTPYSDYFGGGFRRATALRRGGFYYHLEPNNTHVIGGFWGPNAQDLLHIRKQIQNYPDGLVDVLESKEFKTNFGELRGTQLKTYPRGFNPEDPAINLLRYKQYLIRHDFKEEEVRDSDFANILAKQFENMLPFLDVMSEMLTTDLNGMSIV